MLFAFALACISGCLQAPLDAEGSAAGPLYAVVTTDEELQDAAGKAGPAGATIVLRPGQYVLEEALTFTKLNHLNIVGSGWNTTLSTKGAAAIIFEDCGFCEVRDLLIDGPDASGHGSGIVFRGYSSSNRVVHCRIQRFPVSGIRFEGQAEFPMSSNTVETCHFISNRGAQLYSFHNNDFYIVGNQFGTHGSVPEAGAVLDHSSAGSYTLNYHWDNRAAMQLGPGAHFNRIENNRFEESRTSGLVIGAPEGDPCRLNIITGNTFHTNSKANSGKHPAVAAYNAADTTFTNNQVFSWNADLTKHTNGLVLDARCRSWIITSNIFRHHTHKAMDIPDPSMHVVADNLADADQEQTVPE